MIVTLIFLSQPDPVATPATRVGGNPLVSAVLDNPSDRTGDDRDFEPLLQDPGVSEPIRRSLPADLDATTRRDVIESAAQILRESYVFPEVGEEAARAIGTALAEGRYSNIELQSAFAERLTTDLQAVTNDLHLRVSAPGIPIGLPSGVPPPRPGVGVSRADILVDNIGYLEVDAFPASSTFNEPLAQAMAALRGTRALVIDLRRNGGGSAVAVVHFISYFIDSDEPVHIGTIFNRVRGTESVRAQKFWSEPVSA